MQTVKLEVPMDKEILKATAAYFTTLSEIEGVMSRPLTKGVERVSIPPETPLPPSEILNNASSGFVEAPEMEVKVFDAPLPPEVIRVDSGYRPELDTEGMPWDARIHSSGRGTLAKTGCWKRKRNIDPILVAEVEDELRIKYPKLEAPTPPTVFETPAPPVHSVASIVAESTPATTMGAVETSEITQLAQLMLYITSNDIKFEIIHPILAKHGLKGIPELQEKPNLIPVIAKELGA